MDVRLDGRVVLVTGATQGVGQAVALEVARSGTTGVIITDRDAARGQVALGGLRQSGVEAAFIAADLLDVSAPEIIFSAALAGFGRVNALVNAAGMTDRASPLDATPELWDTLFAVNARAAFFLMQKIVAHLKDRASPGSVVNILSVNVHAVRRILRSTPRQWWHWHLQQRTRLMHIASIGFASTE